MRNRLRLLIVLLAGVLLVAGSLLARAPIAAAQTTTSVPLGLQWTPPLRIPGYEDTAAPPYMIADQNHNLYAFNSILLDKNLVIAYSQWNRVSGWSNPVDVLLSPLKQQARIMGAFLDEKGYVNLIFFGGDDLGAAIFFSRAPLIEAGNAQAWEKLALIGDSAITPTAAAMVGDGKGNIVVVYSGKFDRIGLYAVYSADWGRNWSDPSTIYEVSDDVHWPSSLNMIEDALGNTHLVWTVVNDAGNGDFLYYSRLDASTHTWSNPYLLAQRDSGDYEVDWGSIVTYQDQLIVVYDDSTPATRWMRRSLDFGKTWTAPVRPFSYVGEYGFASYVTDSAGYLHMFLGNRSNDNPSTHGMWHSVWLGDRWSDLEPVIVGPSVTDGPLPGRFDPSRPRAVVINGNLILLVWSTDPSAGRNGVWYAVTRLDSPELASAALPTPEPIPTATPRLVASAAQEPQPTLSPLLAQFRDTPTNAEIPDPMRILVSAFFAATVVCGAALVIVRHRFQTRNKGIR